MPGMRRLIAIAVVFAGVTLPVYAQRGGGAGHGGSAVSHGGGFVSHSGGFAVHSAPVFHSSGPMVGRSPYLGSSYRYAPSRLMPSRGPVAGYPLRSGEPDHGSGYRGADRYRRPYFGGYSFGYPTAFTVWPDWYLDSGLYDPNFYDNSGWGNDDSANYANQPMPADYGPQQYSPDEYAAPQYPAPAGYAGPQYPAPPIEQAEAAPGPYRPEYQRPQPAPEPEVAVTLVFKDGRPSEQIHNYMLTRTTLYVQDGTRREIPVDELDVPATQKANHDAGVDFQLPGARR